MVMDKPVTVNDVLDGYVDLDVECLDRIYLNRPVNSSEGKLLRKPQCARSHRTCSV